MGKNAAYAAQYAEEAKEQMWRYGIPASVILAQAILESSNGQSQLSRECNNHFGIKATDSWLKNGGEYGVYTDDRPNEKFCKYKSVGDSYEHHSQFLKQNKRYAQCFTLSPDDYKGWTKGIERAGYATGGGYAASLQRIIEANGLEREAVVSSVAGVQFRLVEICEDVAVLRGDADGPLADGGGSSAQTRALRAACPRSCHTGGGCRPERAQNQVLPAVWFHVLLCAKALRHRGRQAPLLL